MKQFDIEKYLENPKQRVVTRDGRNVRIICTDRRADEEGRGERREQLVGHDLGWY